MLDTPNCTSDRIFPVWFLPYGDDGKRKPFHVVHCLAQPHCGASLRLSPGKHSQLPPECVAKFAEQKGWHCDRKGYALCPEHKPGAHRGPRRDMPPEQKRAAFLAIRDRNLAAAAERMLKPAKPVGALAKEAAAVRARVAAAAEAAEPDPGKAAELVARVWKRWSPLEVRMLEFILDHPARIWPSRREVAKAGGFNIWTFNSLVEKAIREGFIVQEPVAGRAFRPFRLREVDKFDPPAMQPDQPEDSAMNEEAVVSVPKADPPRQATREDNARIRDYLDANFDDGAGRWTGDLSDQKAAERLRVPRAWVSALREFFGDDRNEADERASELALELVADALKMKEDALAFATRAEELERRARAFLDGRRP